MSAERGSRGMRSASTLLMWVMMLYVECLTRDVIVGALIASVVRTPTLIPAQSADVIFSTWTTCRLLVGEVPKEIDGVPDVVVGDLSIPRVHKVIRWNSFLDNLENLGVAATVVPLIIDEVGRV